jgi:hypothetical protein
MHLLLEKLQVIKLSVGQENMVTLALVIFDDNFLLCELSRTPNKSNVKGNNTNKHPLQ